MWCERVSVIINLIETGSLSPCRHAMAHDPDRCAASLHRVQIRPFLTNP